MSGSSYVGQLGRRWGLKAPGQLVRMLKFHWTPFKIILHNIFSALEEVDGRFAFPTIAAVAKMKPELVKMIVSEGHEVASHGYNHVRYPSLTSQERERDLRLSLQVFRKLGIEIKGFRAPYDNYTDDMPLLLEQVKLTWDGGFGYRAENREKTHFFHTDIDGQQSKVTYIPLNIQSDDLMIDRLGMDPTAITKTLRAEVSNAAASNGVIMFDLHPIRMGQTKFVGCLKEVTEHAQGLGAWCTTPAEAVKYWNKHRKWKGDSTFCLLLTGDIDNWVFADYLRRVLWRRAGR